MFERNRRKISLVLCISLLLTLSSCSFDVIDMESARKKSLLNISNEINSKANAKEETFSSFDYEETYADDYDNGSIEEELTTIPEDALVDGLVCNFDGERRSYKVTATTYLNFFDTKYRAIVLTNTKTSLQDGGILVLAIREDIANGDTQNEFFYSSESSNSEKPEFFIMSFSDDGDYEIASTSYLDSLDCIDSIRVNCPLDFINGGIYDAGLIFTEADDEDQDYIVLWADAQYGNNTMTDAFAILPVPDSEGKV